MVKWEYFRFSLYRDEHQEFWIYYKEDKYSYSDKGVDGFLAQLGREGWELVNVVAVSGDILFDSGRRSYNGKISETYIFKRPLAE